MHPLARAASARQDHLAHVANIGIRSVGHAARQDRAAGHGWCKPGSLQALARGEGPVGGKRALHIGHHGPRTSKCRQCAAQPGADRASGWR